MTKKISNKNASIFTTDRVEFKANNIFSEKKNDVYVVYSYGYHFPMFVWKEGIWYENMDKYSVSTSKQQTQSRPLGARTLKMKTQDLETLVNS